MQGWESVKHEGKEEDSMQKQTASSPDFKEHSIVQDKGLLTSLHGAEHGEEGLTYSSAADELHKGGDALAYGAGGQGLDLTGDQPAQGVPAPPHS